MRDKFARCNVNRNFHIAIILYLNITLRRCLHLPGDRLQFLNDAAGEQRVLQLVQIRTVRSRLVTCVGDTGPRLLGFEVGIHPCSVTILTSVHLVFFVYKHKAVADQYLRRQRDRVENFHVKRIYRSLLVQRISLIPLTSDGIHIANFSSPVRLMSSTLVRYPLGLL